MILISTPRYTLGFTLVELAIVLVIVALLTGGLMVGITAQRTSAENSDAQRQLDNIREAPSFETPALESAAEAAPNLPRGLLLECFAAGWRETAQRLGCVAVVAEQGAWTAETVAGARSAGLRMLAYTVNDDAQAAACSRWAWTA